MPDFALPSSGLPFLRDQSAGLTLHVDGSLATPLRDAADALATATFSSKGSTPLVFDGGTGWALSVDAQAKASLSLVRPSSQTAARELGLDAHFAAHPDDVAIVCAIGASGDGAFAGTFRYGPLAVRPTLKSGSDISFRYVRVCPATHPVAAALAEFFGHVRLPGALSEPPAEGEVVEFGYGGSLAFGAELSAGYSLGGTQAAEVGALRVSAVGKVAATGTLRVGATLSGLFSVQVRRDDRGPSARPWARVVVKKNRSRAFSYAADATATAAATLNGLPSSPNALLAGVLGLSLDGWVDALDHLKDFTDWASLETRLDALGQSLVGKLVDQGVDTLKATPLSDILARIGPIVDAYNNLSPTIAGLLERYADALSDDTRGRALRAGLEQIAALTAWDDLKREVSGDTSPLLWTLVEQLTDGDPLGWMAERPIDALRQRAAETLALVGAESAQGVRTLAALVAREFGLGPLLAALGRIDSPATLKTEATTALGAFVDRLVGGALGAARDNAAVAGVYERTRQIVTRAADFETAFSTAMVETLSRTYTLGLHQAYAPSSVEDALVDVSFDLADHDARALYERALAGNFADALAAYRQPGIRVNHGALTHTAARNATLSVTVVGWGGGWKYEGIETLVARTAQQMVGNDQGGVTVFTQVDVTDDVERRWQGQRVATHFLLRLVGESTGILQSDPVNHGYLIDAVSSMQASYQLTFEHATARESDLAFYLGFAKDFGIGADAGFDVATLLGLLRADGGAVAKVAATYDVRYDGGALARLFAQPMDAGTIRSAMRRVVLASYLPAGGHLAAIGWAYATPGIYAGWLAIRQRDQTAFVAPGARRFDVTAAPLGGIAPPAAVTLEHDERVTLDALYRIEDAVIETLAALHATITTTTPRPAGALEEALGAFDASLRLARHFTEGANATFAIFNALMARVATSARRSSLNLKATVGGHETTKVFLST